MKKNLIALAVAAAVLVPGVAFAADSSSNDTGPVVFGYAQITGAQQFGTGPGTSNGLIFGANRIRLGFKGEAVPGVNYFIQGAYDEAGLGNGMPNGLNNGLGGNMMGSTTAQLMDAWINYAPVPFVQLKVGKFKTPEGLEYSSIAGNELPFIYRNMGQSLLPGRSAGAMFHANNVMGSGVGYAVGIFDNTSVDGYTVFSNGNTFGGGQGNMLNGNGKYIVSGMLKYSMGPLLTAEASGSLGTETNRGSDDLYSWNVGVRGGLMGIHYAAGYTNASGMSNWGYLNTNSFYNPVTYTAYDWHAELGANLYEMTLSPIDIEPAIRYDSYTVHGQGTLGNATVGLNYFVNPNNPHAAEVQLNYIMATRGGSINQIYSSSVNGQAPINGVAYNTLMLQFQAGF
ncbi:porin [Acidithiobacillus sp.]|uniref:porin n=1 Tax=Acidithiobacillus sp. TaxID=1872118 RepID=UPI00261F79AB|nr:porin [Acidithiobacillus sp.]MDD2751239.1 porin [Acidithiobacillus sp.]MDD5279072.1 porin [Acidithiobacillus sp.]